MEKRKLISNRIIVCMLATVLSVALLSCKGKTPEENQNSVPSDSYAADVNTSEVAHHHHVDKIFPVEYYGEIPPVKYLISPTEYDLRPVPDTYSCGCRLDKVKKKASDSEDFFVDGVQIKSGNDSYYSISKRYTSGATSGKHVIENYDFTAKSYISCLHGDYGDKKMTLVFKNCLFNGFRAGNGNDMLHIEFENCTFLTNVSGSNFTLDHCLITGFATDAINPLWGVTVKDSYISNRTEKVGDGIHVDGVQIYGDNSASHERLAKDLLFDNLRVEMPYLSIADSTSGYNCCLMLQLEFSNGKNIWFKNCVINGGGHSFTGLYCKNATECKNSGFENISYGSSFLYTPYYNVGDYIALNDIHSTDYLYVSSVYKNKGKIHFYVTNDTMQDRKLAVITNNGRYEFKISGTPDISTEGLTYSDFKIDIPLSVPEADYFIAYDVTADVKQIRFVNYTDSDVYLYELPKDNIMKLASGTTGDCKYVITSDGVCTILGKGAMGDYHSAKPSPFWDYAKFIRKINVEEGVTSIGYMAFKSCSNVSEVSLPSTLKEIKGYSFQNCPIKNLSLPSKVNFIGKHAFGSLLAKKVYYKGDVKNLTIENDTVGISYDMITK